MPSMKEDYRNWLRLTRNKDLSLALTKIHTSLKTGRNAHMNTEQESKAVLLKEGGNLNLLQANSGMHNVLMMTSGLLVPC